MRSHTISAIAILIALGIAWPAEAATSEWFLGKDRYAIGKLLKGKLLLSIKCRDKKTPGLHLGRDEFKITYTDNPSKKKYLWAVGNYFGRYKKRAEKEGYKLVSLNQYTRASGLIIRCAVWHKSG